ncbi:MAG: tetratricopeptide repeat protein [Planctomycetia bacterium]|nr:tetratricopeptide repeat protein [Planctomycetia bacterium]
MSEEDLQVPLQPPAFIHAWVFVLQYVDTREHHRLLLGLPCLVFAAALAGACFAASSSQAQLRQIYLQEAAASLTAGRDDAAELYLRRSLVEHPEDAPTMYQLALAVARSGDAPRAEQLMRRIAPLGQPGYAPASLWLAERGLMQGAVTPHEIELIESDLLYAAADAKVKPIAQGHLANLYLEHERVKEAEPLLASLAEKGGTQRLAAALAYQRLGRAAEARKQAAKAISELRREVDGQPDNGALRMKLADACSMAARWEEGEQALKAGILLDPDGPCVPALAGFYGSWAAALARKSGTASRSEQQALYRKAVGVLEDSSAPSPETRLLLADAAIAAEDEQKAERVLRELAPANVPARLRLGKLLLKRGDEEAARAEVSVVLHDSLVALRDAPDNLLLRQQAADAAELMRNYDQAVELLRGLAASGRYPRLAENVARLRVVQWDLRHRDASQRPSADDVAALMQAFEISPWNQGVVGRLWTASQDETPAGRAAGDFLHDKLAAGNVPVTGHTALGTAAAQAGNYALAREHLELAWRLAPNQLIATNNLAWTLAHCDPPDLPRALTLVEGLLKSEPRPDVVHTRGIIYLKQERWRDAAADLERVLPFRPRDPQLHRALALAFARLNLAEMAKRHELQAEALESAAGSAPTDAGTAR